MVSPFLQSPGTSAKRSSVDAAHSKTTKLMSRWLALPACLVLGCFSREVLPMFFRGDCPRTARDHMPARQFDEFMVGVVIHVTGWSAWCATVRYGSKWATPVRGAGYFRVVHCFFWRCPSVYAQAPHGDLQ